ncbi:MAG: formylglycine-generating enzyme family protein [Gemmataceae bacterium]
MRAALLTLPVFAVLLAAWGAPADEEARRVLKLFLDEFVELTPGQGKFPAAFEMGSPGKDAPAAERPVVTVRFKAPFAVARYEVTQELWAAVTGKNASRWKGKRNSVEMVTWDEARQFCDTATKLLRGRKLLDEGTVIRLPSEAEWEYACRAGTATRYSFGDSAKDLGAYAWFIGNSKGEDPPVGRKKANPWGLYDVHGYVWEWCADAWSDGLTGTPADGSPRPGKGAKERVIRGGSWADSADHARSAYRGKAAATTRNDRIGFRCVKAKKEGRE